MTSAPDRRKRSAHVFWRDAFQLGIPTNRAVRMQRIAQPHDARVETRAAFRASPRVDTHYTQNIVRSRLPARASRTKMFTDRADHLSNRASPLPSSFSHSIGQCAGLGKRPRVLATGYNSPIGKKDQLRQGATMPDYTEEHAKAGIQARLPALETWPNQYPGYVVTTRYPEYSSVCPKTGLPDYGTITIQYKPRKACVELKSLKLYLLAYRNLGIFYENAVNKMLHDLVAAMQPEWCVVKGEFTPRGGLNTSVFARWPKHRRSVSRPK